MKVKNEPNRSEINIAVLVVAVLTFQEIIPYDLGSETHISNQSYAVRLISGLLANTRYEDDDMPDLPFDI